MLQSHIKIFKREHKLVPVLLLSFNSTSSFSCSCSSFSFSCSNFSPYSIDVTALYLEKKITGSQLEVNWANVQALLQLYVGTNSKQSLV